MRKIFTLAIVALFTLNLSAQKIEKGIWQIEIGTGIQGNYNWITGGSIDYKQTIINPSGSITTEWDGDWSDFYNSETDLGFNLDFTNFSNWEERFLNGISFGYFVADGFLIGLGLDLDGLNTKDDYFHVSDTNTQLKINKFDLGVVPKLRYYIPIPKGNAVFFETSFGLGIDNRNTYEEGHILIPPPATTFGQLGTFDTEEVITNTFTTNLGIGFGWSFFSFNSREIFAIEPMIGFNINSSTTREESIYYQDAIDQTTTTEEITKTSSMGAYAKIKLAFYLGRHFWSH
jgi:hypothetical protein